MFIKESKLSEFLDKEYHKYAIYTIENRAIGSCIDGMKPIQRKIFYTALNNVKNSSNKVSTLAGKVISEAMYHNGNISCEEAIVLMTQDFKNNIPYFKGIGQFGSLKNPFSSSSRYISVSLSTSILDVFKDEYLLEHNIEESVIIEPKFYLPIIPMIIINGTSGIALGYNTKILNRNPLDVINVCIKLLGGKKITNSSLNPKITGFTGKVEQSQENEKKWFFTGIYEIVNANTIRISEIPPSMTYEKYELFLEDMLEKKEIISYENLSNEKVNYVVKINREKLSEMDSDEIIKTFKLQESHNEILTTLDENGKLKIFDSIEQIIEYFIGFRLVYYTKRKEFLIDKMKNELKVLTNKSSFVKYILDGSIEVKNISKNVLLKNIEDIGLDKIDGDYDYLLRMSLWSLTKEVFDKIKSDFESKKLELDKFSSVNPSDMYMDDLLELKKRLK